MDGCGDAVVDPEMGAGAYLIEGGRGWAFIEGMQMGAATPLIVAEYILSVPVPGWNTLIGYLALSFAGTVLQAINRV